jgi:hypothetical protein
LPKGREASTQRRRRCFTRWNFCSHDDVDCRQVVLDESKTLFDYAPKTISRDCIAGGFNRDGEAEPRMCEPILFHSKTEKPIVDATAAGVDRIELQLAAQTQLRTKT